MPARDTAPVGSPCWVDLSTSDPEGSRTFYTELFGWEAEEPAPEFGGYFNFTKDGVRIAGCMASQLSAAVPDVWSIYLTSDDAGKTVAAASAAGGSVIVPPMPVGDLGTMAVVVDVGGAAIGVWQPGQHQGFGLLGDPGTPSWFELHTRDYGPALTFYREVFRWDTESMGDTDEFRYTVLKHGAEQLAGVMDAGAWLPVGAPGVWWVYFGTDDTDAALRTITDLGGSVVAAAEDTPYGRLAAASDPSGAKFRLVGPNAGG